MAKKYLGKVLIIDGSYMMHRVGHTPALQDLCTSSGVKSGMILGFLRSFQSEIRKFSEYFPIVCWDKGLAKRRTDLYPDYKANRRRQAADNLLSVGTEGTLDEYLIEYRKQRDDLIQVLKYLGVPSLIIPGWEGDDLQYLLTKIVNEGIVLSDDRDMIQLVSPTIRIRRAMQDEMIAWDTSDPFYRHPHFTIVKAICGDRSDNIPQVTSGLGQKGADKIASLIDNSDTLEGYKSILQEYVETNSGPLALKVKKLLENWDQFVINYKLINLRLVESPHGFEMMLRDLIMGVVGKSNILKAYQILGKYELNTIYPDQIISFIAASSSQVVLPE